MKWMVSFVSHQSFLDPPLTNDGQPYGPWKYRQLVKECYLIAKNSGIPYSDVLHMNPTERQDILDLISDEFKRAEQKINQITQK